MTINLALYECEDEDYIEMEMTSSPSNSLHVSTNSSPQNQEFEFPMPSTSNNTQSTISTADELFYNGKILPLHLTLRRKMVQNLLLHHTATASAAAPVEIAKQPVEENGNYFTLPFDSCRESCEMDLDDCLFEWPIEFTGFINNHPTRRSWSKKLKLIKNSILVQKLKFFFNKSACTDESCSKENPTSEPLNLPKTEESSNKFTTFAKKKPFGFTGENTNPTADSVTNNIDDGAEENVCRKSVSDAKYLNSPVKFLSTSSSSSSSSCSSSVLKRSSSATEIEGSIEAAIDHCKKSQQLLDKFLDCYCIDL